MATAKKWNILASKKSKWSSEAIVDQLLKNRGIKTPKAKKEFISPKDPTRINLNEVGLDTKNVSALIARLQKVQKNKETVIVYGDYDTDGICATAVLWECLYKLGFDVLPHIPDRFEEGYGLNAESVEVLKENHPKLGLIITVDNGIVANEGAEKAKQLGIDVVISDHHQKAKKLPTALSIIHTTEVGGAGISWFIAREIQKKLGKPRPSLVSEWLVLAAIGTVADIIPLLGVNRSVVKFGIELLRKTRRVGLNKLIDVAGIDKTKIGTYEVGFVISPRINAMGRLKNGIDALRLLCTTDIKRAASLARTLNSTNFERIGVVEQVVAHAKSKVDKGVYSIVLAHGSYHEGVIGLAASELVKKHYRPAIVISKGKEFSKASARSIPGFNIIEAIRELDSLTVGGGGHPMAAGFTIKTENIERFTKKFEELAKRILTDDLLERNLKVDIELEFTDLSLNLLSEINQLSPFGNGNPEPVFATNGVDVLDFKTVGKEGAHLKLFLQKGGARFSAIAFKSGNLALKLTEGAKINVAYSVFDNSWNGKQKLELRISDMQTK